MTDLSRYQDPHTILATLLAARTIAIVGLSKDPLRPSYFIGFYLKRHGYKVVVGDMQPKAALDEAVGKVKEIMTKNGFYQGKDPMNFAATAPGMWVGKGKPLPF